MTIDQQFVEFVIKSLVTKPDEVKIERRIDEKGVLLELTVDPEDLGRVIGKRGATAQSVRTLLRALGTKNDARYNLKIVDNGVNGGRGAGEESRSRDETAAEPADDAWTSSASTEQEPETAEVAAVGADEESDVVAKTRRELRDLDDLDV